MGRKRLITDSYPVVKRREGPAGLSKGELATELEEEIQPLSVDEVELELLRQFDLAWQYGPCTVSGISIPFEVPPKVSCSLPKNLRTQARASYCLSAQPCCGGRCRKESCRERETESGSLRAHPSI
ncbi:DNA polymerase delta subunit 4 isoform X1 [Myotis lucifugus]|uniref:DNA polymerase delta subunit 4 isoform X1 n=1 Tax=Myotis lucifugus TaxID=59463 RepID=UPI000CCC5B15|nr:DNA polymerase delta subunit 4 isoform X1 [Myotis lucifugus]